MSTNVGEFAGQIWHNLNSNGDKPVSLTALAKETGLSKDAVALGIGWLSKEGQIAFADGKTLKVSLIK